MMNFKVRIDSILISIPLFICAIEVYSQEKEKGEILNHGEVIRTAFSKGDIEAIKMLHHPEVIKALGYKKLLSGRDAVIEDLTEILERFTLSFVENKVENIFIQGDVAIEQTLFSIKGIPKKDGNSFVFSGRTMVTYVRSRKSPTGWATIREIIQPASE